jgi:hypothetical protein
MFGLFDLVAKLFYGPEPLEQYVILRVYRLFTLQLIEIMPAAPIVAAPPVITPETGSAQKREREQ